MALALRTILLGAVLVFQISGVAAGRPALPPARMEQLSRYDVLLFSDPAGAGLQRHKVIGVFDATPEEILRVATGFEHYPEYVPRIIESHTLSQAGERMMVHMEADLPWPMSNARVQVRYVTDPLADPAGSAFRVRFEMVRGNLLRYEGSFLIEPFGDGRSSVTYELLAQPDSRLPRGLLQGAVGRGALNFVHCLRWRVNQLARQGLLHAPSPPSASAQEDPAP